jgi:hypothetical protein
MHEAIASTRMQISIRMLVLGLPLVFAATAVHAQATAPATPLPPPSLATTSAAPPQFDIPLTPTTLSPTLSPTLLPALPPAAPAAPSLQTASSEVQGVARWVAASRDNLGLPYLLIDKANATVYAFNSTGQLQGTAPALLGMSRGDHLLAPNTAAMSAISPEQRITPAGRYISRLTIDSHGKELLVIDYEASISLHPVVKGTPEEHRAERLKSPTSQDNRISFGCINVPPEFYSTFVSPAFAHTKGVVYILPETAPAAQLFGFQPEATASATTASAAADTGTVQTARAPGTN